MRPSALAVGAVGLVGSVTVTPWEDLHLGRGLRLVVDVGHGVGVCRWGCARGGI